MLQHCLIRVRIWQLYKSGALCLPFGSFITPG